MGAPAKLKYHYFYRFFTYSVKRRAGRKLLDSGIKPSASPSGVIRSEDSVRRGV